MKSIMEQASSIIKAIEKAWISADKPKEFSVKIFEKEEKNFFGMTTKPAKIGIFFSEKNAHQEKAAHKNHREVKEQRHEAPKQNAMPAESKQRPEHKTTTQPNQPKAERVKEAPKKEKSEVKPQRMPATWNDSMVTAVSEWLHNTLGLMEIRSVDFTPEIMGKVLKLTFAQPLLEDAFSEKQLFRSVAHLVMASLRNQFKQEIKDLKIVLLRPQ